MVSSLSAPFNISVMLLKVGRSESLFCCSFFLFLPVCVWENADLKATQTVYTDSKPESNFKTSPKTPKYQFILYLPEFLTLFDNYVT